MGAPDAVSKQMGDKLIEAVEKQKIGMVRGKDANAEYVVRGYVVAAKEGAGTKLSYIWDITDKSGTKRIQRIQGEEMVKAAAGQDPWSSMDDKVLQALAEKTAVKIAQALPPASSSAAIASAPAAGGGVNPAAAQAPVKTAALAKGATAASQTTTASIGRDGDVTTFVPTVAGAPGDGPTALSNALRRELERNNVALANGPGATGAPGSIYKVQGKVTMGPAADGKQSIQIDWIVADPSGKRLGTVSQKNMVQQGSLDGSWGQTAELAASAAAQGIVKLLPPAKSVN